MPDPLPKRQTVDFEAIRLKVGDTLQMQPVGLPEPTHYAVRFMGALRNSSILTTLPIVDNEAIWMKPNGEYIFRVLSGSHVYAFVARLIKARAHPYSYAHFAYPEAVEARQVRRSPRVRLRLDSVVTKADGGSVPVTFLDLSLHGALVETDAEIGQAGESVRVELPIHLSEVNRKLTLAADIRNEVFGERPRYGLEFQRLADDDVLLLHFFIDHLIVEGGGA